MGQAAKHPQEHANTAEASNHLQRGINDLPLQRPERGQAKDSSQQLRDAVVPFEGALPVAAGRACLHGKHPRQPLALLLQRRLPCQQALNFSFHLRECFQQSE